jgi:hypothetical protein
MKRPAPDSPLTTLTARKEQRLLKPTSSIPHTPCSHVAVPLTLSHTLFQYATATACTLASPGVGAPALAIATAVACAHQSPNPDAPHSIVAVPTLPWRSQPRLGPLLPSLPGSAPHRGRKRKAPVSALIDLTSSPPPSHKQDRTHRDTHTSRGRGALASQDQQLAILTAGLPRTARVFPTPPCRTCLCIGNCCCPRTFDV